MDLVEQLIGMIEQLDVLSSTEILSFEVLNNLDEIRYHLQRALKTIQKEREQKSNNGVHDVNAY